MAGKLEHTELEGSEDSVREGKGKLSLSKQSEDLAQNMSRLSPTTQENLGVLLQSISIGEAYINTDSEGRAQIEYKAAKKTSWDGSNVNTIAEPKSDVDIKNKMDACFEMIRYLKKSPAGVLLDKTKISLSPSKKYRDGFEFDNMKKVLGRGIVAGDIVVVKDKKTGHEHALKTMMISVFREEEIRCWVDMSDSGYVPSLYLFRIENDKVCMHMEILKNAKTLRSIMEEHMDNVYQNEALAKPFSLYVLDGALEAITEMHGRGWVHNDPHDGNVMVQKAAPDKLDVKVLDFGCAKTIIGQREFKADIIGVLRLFSGLYTGQKFNDAWDLECNWKNKLTELTKLNVDDRKELFCLMDAAMEVVHPDDIQGYRDLVKSKLENAMGDAQSKKNIMKKIAAILFPEDFKPVHSGQSEDHVVEADDADTCGSQHNGNVDNQHGNTDNHEDIPEPALGNTSNQASDEYCEKLRMTFGIDVPTEEKRRLLMQSIKGATHTSRQNPRD